MIKKLDTLRSKFFQIINSIFLDKNEIKFIKNSEVLIKKNNVQKKVLIQCSKDYSHFYICSQFLKNENLNNIYGFIPYQQYYNSFQTLFIFPRLLQVLKNYLYNKKWIKLYRKIGVKIIYKPNNISVLHKLYNFYNALKFFKSFSSKKDLLNFKYKNICSGKLIYNTYLRFSKKPSLEIEDFNLVFYIASSLNQIDYFSKIKLESFDDFYAFSLSYIGSGIPLKVIKKSKINSYVYVGDFGNSSTFKKLEADDYLQVKNHWNYRYDFKKLKNKMIKIDSALKNFQLRFIGDNDLNYLNYNQYKYENKYLGSKLDGVVFLHDYCDSPHVFRNMVFNDFYEWTLFLIDIVRKNNLNIGFKPHPNQVPSSKKIIQKLIDQYDDILWIDQNISNQSIFNSGINFGTSVYGTVLTELAFHKITPISCGDNPSSEYSFCLQAKNKDHYRDLILNRTKIKFDKNKINEIGEYYYMNYMHKTKNKFNLNEYIEINKVFPGSSSLLNEIF